MSSYDRVLDACSDIFLILAAEELKRIERRRNRPWVRKWIQRRRALGGSNLVKELRDEDPRSYRNMLRMNADKFDELLAMVQPFIQKEDTKLRRALPAQLKLEVTLRFLATGDSFSTLAYFFRLPPSSICTFLPEVLQAIVEALSKFMKTPRTTDEWMKISAIFAQRWNFPRACGAMDGKHIAIKQPPCSGSLFYNYKGFHSVVLFALVDGNYNFIYVNTGTNGRVSDAGIFARSQLYESLENGNLNVPPDHVFLGDSAFPLKTYLMKPYSRRYLSSKEHIFNYRLSRARRIVENAFGILTWRFRIFSRTMELKLKTVDQVVLAACSLHNWLRSTTTGYLTPNMVDSEDLNTGEVVDGLWRTENVVSLPSIEPSGSNNYSQDAEQIRTAYKNYFWCDGAITGQWRAVGLCPDQLVDLQEEFVDDEL